MAQNPVAEKSNRWKELEALRSIGAPLWGGTLAMREAGEALMPPHEGEKAIAIAPPPQLGSAPEVLPMVSTSISYDLRLGRAVLWPEYRRQLTLLAGKLFRRPLKLGPDVKPTIADLSEDVDRRGNNLHNFALVRFLHALRDGFSLILVDAPRAAIEAGVDPKRRSASEEATAGIRPFLVAYDASQLIGSRTEIHNGKWRLTQARLYECSLEPAGEYGEAEVERIRVFRSPVPGIVTSETWKRLKGSQDDFAIEHQLAPISNVREIPLVAVYGNWEHGYFDAEPAFVDLAHLNVRDWQVSSDIDNILRVGIVPKPYVTGVEPGTLKAQLWTVDQMLELQKEGSRILFAEIEGKGLELAIGQRDDGRMLMKQLGLEVLLPMKSGQMTDDEVQARSTDAISPLQALALALTDSLEQSIRFMAQYYRLGDDAGGSVAMSSKLFLTAGEVSDLQALQSARKGQNGRPDIDHKTYLDNLVRLSEALPEDADTSAIIAAVEQESRGRELLTGALDDLAADAENPDSDDESTESAAPPRPPQPGVAADRAA